jgi:tRNA threonylcarbamoyladenosine biosynthesis protein TsaE
MPHTASVRIESGSAEDTRAAGAELAGRLAPGDVVLVSGELGTGKTTFVRGACRPLGVDEPVTSPTFTVGQLYRGQVDGRAVEVAHLDLYRLATLASEDPGLLDDYLTPDRIAFVEWPAAAEPELEVPAAARVTIAHTGGDRRVLEIA